MIRGKVLVTGAGGLVGSEAVKYFHDSKYEVIGIDSDDRKRFFGKEASVASNILNLIKQYSNYVHYDTSILNQEHVDSVIKQHKPDIIIHAAAQPSHDLAASIPILDFKTNALGTLNLLEAVRANCKDSIFIFTSTNKVYGDAINKFNFLEEETRYELPLWHSLFEGVDESFSIDRSLHSLFGVSKTSADLLVQEYGRYFDMNTVCFRCGCITGSKHKGAELHGFLSYIVKCILNGDKYKIYGYKGKQVRDNLHVSDLVLAMGEYINNPLKGEVFNIGGSRDLSCSILEVIDMLQNLTNKRLNFELMPDARVGDHQWWITNMIKFKNHYPNWKYSYSLSDILEDLVKC